MDNFIQTIRRILGFLFKEEQPYIRNVRNRELINYWWSEVFYSPKHLRKMAGKYPLNPRPGYGLVYYYYIGGRLRYVGQTRERSLRWRMTRRQANRHIGYNYSIKRQMLNAYRAGKLSIVTREVKVADLDKVEREAIEANSRWSKLWNIEHNKYFNKSNRQF